MARLPLIINDQRLKTLEGLRENFNLTELLERYRGGQLRAWLNCWDFDSELEQLGALSSDLPEPELLTALCHIFGVEGDAKEQALTAFREEQEKREEQQQEAERQQKLREQEEQRKAEQTKPLTLDEIEFDWQETEAPKIDLLTSGADRFVAIQNGDYKQDKLFFYSYDGLHWNKVKPDSFIEHNAIEDIYCCNGNFILQVNYKAYYSSDFIHWNKLEVDEDGAIKKLIWTGDRYIALISVYEDVEYLENWGFFYKTRTVCCKKSKIYAAEKLAGPWYKEKQTKSISVGEYFSDIVFFNNQFIANGSIDICYAERKELKGDTQLCWYGKTISEMERFVRKKSAIFDNLLWKSRKVCFSYSENSEINSCVTHDGSHWNENFPYAVTELVDADRFIVARLFELGESFFNVKDIGFHLSLDGINWRKLNAPLQKGKIAYLDGKLLIADGNKIAVGTLKIAHKDNTSSCSTHSCNTSTEDRDLHYNVELSAEEAKSGTIKEVTVTRTEICSLCSGSGRESGSGEKNCTNCNGCGLVQGSKSIKVRIPADVKSGAKLRIRGQGNAGRGEAQPGDLYVHITVREEPSVSPSQTNSTNHTTPLKEIADAMNPLKNPAVLISPTGSIAKLIATKLKSSDNISELIATHLKSGIISEEGKNK